MMDDHRDGMREAGDSRLEAGDCRLEAAGRDASDERRPISPGPRATGHESRVTPFQLVTGHESRVTACSRCIYARRPSGRWLRLALSRWLGLLLCTNHPDARGDIIAVPACSRCRNFRPQPEPVDRLDVGDQKGLLVCTVPLTRRKVATVDAADYERVSRFKWCADRVGLQWYAQRRADGRTIRMHQFIMNPPKGMVVDHANGNGLDNRRENLRVCTKLENAWNKRRRKQQGAGSQFIGVYPCQRPAGKWCIKIQRDGEVTNLGSFDTPEEAARVRDRKAVEFFGDYAILNFPQEREQRLREIEAEKKDLDTDSHG